MSTQRRCSVFLAFLVMVLAVAPASAAGWPVERGPSRELVPYRYQPEQWKTVPSDYLDDAPACTLYSGITHLVEEDGTIETITHEVTRLNSRKALDKLGEYRSITYTPAYEKLTLNEARVHKADGRIVPVEAKHVQLRDQGTDFQVYDTGKILIISFPTLEVGDVIEVRWTVRGKNPEHAGHFFTRYTFGDDTYPVGVDEMRVRLPKARALKSRVTGGKLDATITDDGPNRIYHWRAVNTKQLPQDDSLPSKEELRLQVAVSTFATWDEVLKWKQNLRKECWQCTAELRQIVQDVTKDLKTPTDKARALTYWMRRHIRYVSLGEKHDYTPHTPAQVLNTRFGDCKDTSQFLAVMFREAGIPVGLVTLGARDDGQILEDVPSPWGTHAIVLATIDGKEHWIDTTASLAAWDFLPRDDRDRQVYIVDDKGLTLRRTPKLTADDNRIQQTTYLQITADGSSHSERSSTYFGSAALSRRNDWVDVPSGERRRLASSELLDAQNTAHLARLTIDEAKLRDYDQPVKAEVVFDVPDHFTGDPDREGSITDSPLWGRLLAYTLDPDRQSSLELGSPFESVHRYIVQLAPGYRLDSVPKECELVSKWGTFKLTVKTDPDRPRYLELHYHTRLEKTRVEPADFAEFHQFQDFVSKHYRIWMTLKPGRDAADIAVLEAVLAVAPGDSDAATTLASLYLESEKPDEARRVLRRARSYHPDDVDLAELAVQAAADDAEEEAAHRELVKRFPKTFKYPLALADLLNERGKSADVRAVLEPVLKGGSPAEKASAYYHLARAAFAQNKAREALKHLEAGKEADADTLISVSAVALKGLLHEKLGQTKEAADAYKQVLKLQPGSLEAMASLIRLALADKDQATALEYLRRYTVQAADDPTALALAADFHLQLGRYDEAYDLATRARDAGEEKLTERTLGLAYLHRGDYEKALDHLEAADLDITVFQGRIRTLLGLGRLDRAVKFAERVRREVASWEDEETVKLLFAALGALDKRRQAVLAEVPPAKAAEWRPAVDALVCAEQAAADSRPAEEIETLLAPAFRDGVEIGPAFALRAQLAVDKGRLLKALGDAERAVTLSPKDSRGYYVRGRVRLERGEKTAMDDLAKAAELSAHKDAFVLHWLATAQYQAGQKAAALATQREAVKLRPKEREMAEQLRDFEKEGKSSGGGQ
jgi:tetratricopeptide (TPR) repeat protein/transglutaminase-like putative cysteine protease